MNHTQHAQVRYQQRGIPPVICEWLFEYGSQMESHGATSATPSTQSTAKKPQRSSRRMGVPHQLASGLWTVGG